MKTENKGRLLGFVPTRSKDGYCISQGQEIRLPGGNITVDHGPTTRPVSKPYKASHFKIGKIR